MALTKIDDRGLKTPIALLDSENIRFGTGNDIEIYHDGTNSYLENDTGYLYLKSDYLALRSASSENYIIAESNGAVQLYHNNVKKLETGAGGIAVTGYVNLLADGTNSGGSLYLPDSNGSSSKIHIGTGSDLQIYHNGNNSFIEDTGTGDFYIRGADNIRLQSYSDNEDMAKFIKNGAVELYYNNVLKLNTGSNGVAIAGNLYFTGADDYKVIFGAGQDLQIWHDGSHSWVNNDTGNLYIKGSDVRFLSQGNEDMIKAIGNGAVNLYYDNVKKLETSSTGAIISSTNPFLEISGSAASSGDTGIFINANANHWLLKADNYTAGNQFQIKTGDTSSSTSIIAARSNGYVDFTGASDLRVTFGSQGTAGTNDSNWVRGEGVNLMFNSASGNHTWEVGGTEKLRLQSGGGISFNGDNQAANALSDYEEGTFTPGVTFGNNNSGQSFDGNTGGAYTKIGRMVYIHGRIEFTDKGSSTGNAKITGLPFAAANVTSGNSSLEGGCYFTYESNFMSGEDRASVLAYITQGNSHVELYFRNNSGDLNQISNSDFEDTTNLAFEGIYPAA